MFLLAHQIFGSSGLLSRSLEVLAKIQPVYRLWIFGSFIKLVFFLIGIPGLVGVASYVGVQKKVDPWLISGTGRLTFLQSTTPSLTYGCFDYITKYHVRSYATQFKTVLQKEN
jgi:hypothetical protein